MSNTKLGLLVGGLLIAFLVTQLPARTLSALLPRTVSLEGYSGTLWYGQAARASLQIAGKTFQLGRLEWSVELPSLLLLSPAVAINSQWGRQHIAGTFAVGLGGDITVEGLSANVDVAFARHLLPLYVGGILQVDLAHLSLRGRTPMAAEGRLVWQDAVWTARAGDVPLGNYALDAQGDDGRLVADVETLSGPLRVSGQATLDQRDYRLALALEGPATQNAGLAQSLALLATPTTQGYAIDLNGRL